jgi:hypothetical protein
MFLICACADDESRFVPAESLPATTSTSRPPPRIANAEATVAAMRAGFRTCYNKGLSTDPDMAGVLVISIKIAPDGAVVDVMKIGGGGLAADVEECILSRARRSLFEAPGGTGSTIQFPVRFVRQGHDDLDASTE